MFRRAARRERTLSPWASRRFWKSAAIRRPLCSLYTTKRKMGKREERSPDRLKFKERRGGAECTAYTLSFTFSSSLYTQRQKKRKESLTALRYVIIFAFCYRSNKEGRDDLISTSLFLSSVFGCHLTHMHTLSLSLQNAICSISSYYHYTHLCRHRSKIWYRFKLFWKIQQLRTVMSSAPFFIVYRQVTVLCRRRI